MPSFTGDQSKRLFYGDRVGNHDPGIYTELADNYFTAAWSIAQQMYNSGHIASAKFFVRDGLLGATKLFWMDFTKPIAELIEYSTEGGENIMEKAKDLTGEDYLKLTREFAKQKEEKLKDQKKDKNVPNVRTRELLVEKIQNLLPPGFTGNKQLMSLIKELSGLGEEEEK